MPASTIADYTAFMYGLKPCLPVEIYTIGIADQRLVQTHICIITCIYRTSPDVLPVSVFMNLILFPSFFSKVLSLIADCKKLHLAWAGHCTIVGPYSLIQGQKRCSEQRQLEERSDDRIC